MRYRDAGVDVSRSDALKEALGAAVRSTWTPGVKPLVGGFAGVMEFPGGGLLAATMDGVGTKLHLAIAAGRVADAAADLVYHGANDLLVHGGRPLCFLDYIAQSRLDSGVVLAAVEGLARACREVGAVLLGGETAEMPDTYVEGVVDVAGCLLGVVRRRMLDGSAVRAGDVRSGSARQAANGSLARRVLAQTGSALTARCRAAACRWATLLARTATEPALAGPLARRSCALARITGRGSRATSRACSRLGSRGVDQGVGSARVVPVAVSEGDCR
jgi:phosphoribosylformylglycinamidine cyclo-ligase